VVFANGHELTEAVAGIAEARDIGCCGPALCGFLAEVLLHDVIEMQLVILAQLDVDISRALVQTDVGKSRTAKAVKVCGNSGLVRSLVVRCGDKFQEAQNRRRGNRGDLVLAGNDGAKGETLVLSDALVGQKEEDFIFLYGASEVAAEFIVLVPTALK
jgi:hypothetical protein